MAVRYIINKDAHLVVGGRKKFFSASRRQPDGSLGYTFDELKGLTRGQQGFFRKVNISGDEIVEQATAAPGEKRARRPKEETAKDAE